MNRMTQESCTEWHELIALDVEGDLQVAEAEALRRHLEGCPACRDFARDMRTSQDAWKGALAPPPAGDDVFAAIRANVHRQIGARHVLPFRRPRLSWRHGLALAASAVLAVALWRMDWPRPATTPPLPAPPRPVVPPPVTPPPVSPPPSQPPSVPPPSVDVPPPAPPSPSGEVWLTPGGGDAGAIWVDDEPSPTAGVRWLEAPSPPPPSAAPPPSLLKLEPDDDVVIYWLAEPAATTREKNDESTVYL